jgi:hypothetical protein
MIASIFFIGPLLNNQSFSEGIAAQRVGTQHGGAGPRKGSQLRSLACTAARGVMLNQ